jgi:hypothetical protein
MTNMHGSRRQGALGVIGRALMVALALLVLGPLAAAAAAPGVTITKAPASVSNETTPSFSGTTDDLSALDEVKVNIYAGTEASGTALQTLSTLPVAGAWSVGPAASLVEGTYTAQASETNLIPETGTSNAVTFTVVTAAPSVTLNTPLTPSGNTNPSFGGTASDNTQVTVHVLNGAKEQVATATAGNTPGSWSSGGTNASLSEGSYTAYATQPSSLVGNPEGTSNTVSFVVHTAAPSVTLNTPLTPSGNTNPSFGGTASDNTQVTVHVLNGAQEQVATATAGNTPGSWSSGGTNASLSEGSYTAYATQPSSLVGNPEGTSNTVSFVVHTAPPTVTLSTPLTPSNNTTPSFSGFGSDKGAVTIVIYSNGNRVSEATAEGNAAEWHSGAASPALADGSYTAVASQISSFGNAQGHSNQVSFTVITKSPTVTLEKPKSPSNNTTPSFSGSASDTEPVAINIYSGGSPSGEVVAKAVASGTGGGFSSGAASPGLPTGEYTAVATQPSSLKNPPGNSGPVTFVIDTRSPVVGINQPPSLSNNATPVFFGGASDSKEQVIVHILNSGNSQVASATASPSGGGWSTSKEGSLSSGTYSAYATQASSLGNKEGESGHVSFTIERNSPKVAVKSPGRTNNVTPSFSGTGSDTTTVTVSIYNESKTEGTPVATATASGTGGAWTSGPASASLANGRYTAVARQPSSLGNPPGVSAPEAFEVNTSAPTVTLNPPPVLSNNTTPAFTGTASETETVTVRIYHGTKAEGSVVASATATGTGGAWTSTAAGPALARGTYTANATQPSLIPGNPAGVSASVTFTVETESPHVTLNAIPSLSNNTAPVFTGTGSDVTPITVHIYNKLSVEVAKATASGTGAAWTSGPATPALPGGTLPGGEAYTAVATQPSSALNPEGVSNPPIAFKVETAPPAITLTQPKSPWNNTTPSFTGSASDSTLVTVHVYDASKLEIAKATATPNGKHEFSTAGVPHLADGTYTATATEPSSLKNPEGMSNTVTMIINTAPPTVTLSAPPSPANNLTPTFAGTANDTTPAFISVYVGTKASGSPIATATAQPPFVGGAWISSVITPALPKVKQTYTAMAIEASSIPGNPTGKSGEVHFLVDPAAPTVTLNAPAARSNNAAPSFSGSASDTSQVTVEIYAGAKVEGNPKPVSIATAAGTAGAWSSGPASPTLPDGHYTVVARQANRITPQDIGTSERFTLTIDTVAPHVTLTAPANGSASGGSVVASGRAGTEEGDVATVTAQLFAGATITGGQAPVQSVAVPAAGGEWSAGFAGLAPGTYTLRAQQADEAGNLGISATSTIVVVGPPAAKPAAAPAGPTAAFAWFPAQPHVGDRVSLVSTSTDPGSPFTAFAWDAIGKGMFLAGAPVLTMQFSTAGGHVVSLRVTDARGLSSVASERIVVAPRRARLMRPFPVVKIVTSRSAGGVNLLTLLVQAPVKARISVRCSGKACPIGTQVRVVKARRAAAATVAFRSFERFLPAGVTLEIRVYKPGVVGKYTRLRVRARGVTERLDTCLGPAGIKPVGCPRS